MYIAAVLTADSQQLLFDAIGDDVIPEDWTKIGHHMTVEFSNTQEAVKPGYFPEHVTFGMKVKIKVKEIRFDHCAMALVVESTPSKEDLRVCNKVPHITVAVAPGIKPFYSNQLLEKDLQDVFVEPIDQFEWEMEAYLIVVDEELNSYLATDPYLAPS